MCIYFLGFTGCWFMADLFIIKRRLKFSLWLALIGTGLAGLATWYFYSQLEFEVDNHKFLLSAAITGAMALGTVGLVLFNLAARRVIDPSQSLTDRIDNLPWWTVKVVALLVMIGVLGGVVYRFSGRAEDEFDLLRDDELVVLKERIEANPAVLERKENKKSGITLVQVAYRENRSEAVELLLASGASVDGLDAMGRNPVIASLNNLPMLEILLGAGMDPNMADAEGVPPIHYAISLNSTNVVGLLLDAGAKIDGRDYLYRTPLMRAVKSDNLPMAGFLLEKGADVNAFDQRGNTPLHVAVRRRNEESVRLLLEKGADPKVFNFTHMTPLHIAALGGHDNLVSIFLEVPGMTGLTAENDRTALDHALKVRKYETAELLIAAGANVNRVLLNGDTLLHQRILARDFQTSRFLIRNGADAYIANATGETAHDIMLRKQLTGLLDLVAEIENPGSTTNTVEAVELP